MPSAIRAKYCEQSTWCWSSANHDKENACSMAPMENYERKSAVPRSDPYIRNWRIRYKQEIQKGIKCISS